MKNLPKKLFELVSERKIIPVIGSAFSVPSGLPSWSSMLSDLINYYYPQNERILITKAFQNKKSPDLADFLDTISISDYNIKDFISEKINNPNIQPTQYHKFLIDLQPDTIITTNWDLLIEQAYNDNKIPLNVIYSDNHVANFDTNKKTQLLKIHGSINDFESLVYKKSSYEEFWKENKVLYSLLVTLISTRNLLFIGYGLGDPNVLLLLDLLKRTTGKFIREHFALIFGNDSMNNVWQRYDVNIVYAPEFEELNRNYEDSIIKFFKELTLETQSVALSNLDRSKTVNHEIEKLIEKRPPNPTLYFRGSIGWLSNPVPDKDDIIYGEYLQDVEERRMSELIIQFLEANPKSKVKNIMHIRSEPLLLKHKPQHLIRRFLMVKEFLERFPNQIEIVHDNLPSYSNHMVFDNESSLVGFKHTSIIGINRIVINRDRRIVRSEIQHYNHDFDEIKNQNLILAESLGIDIDLSNWDKLLVKKLIDDELNELFSKVNNPTYDKIIFNNYPDKAIMYCNALLFASIKHTEYKQTREDNITPYYIHILRVVDRLRYIGKIDDYEVLAAAALHDVIEDCNVDITFIKSNYGERVAKIVDDMSKKENQSEEDYIAQIRNSSHDSKAVKLADRWDNIFDLINIRKNPFGIHTPLEYIEYAKKYLEICKESNQFLAIGLENEIAKAMKIFTHDL